MKKNILIIALMIGVVSFIKSLYQENVDYKKDTYLESSFEEKEVATEESYNKVKINLSSNNRLDPGIVSTKMNYNNAGLASLSLIGFYSELEKKDSQQAFYHSKEIVKNFVDCYFSKENCSEEILKRKYTKKQAEKIIYRNMEAMDFLAGRDPNLAFDFDVGILLNAAKINSKGIQRLAVELASQTNLQAEEFSYLLDQIRLFDPNSAALSYRALAQHPLRSELHQEFMSHLDASLSSREKLDNAIKASKHLYKMNLTESEFRRSVENLCSLRETFNGRQLWGSVRKSLIIQNEKMTYNVSPDEVCS